MDVDNVDSEISDGGKYFCMKHFVVAARDFVATQSDDSLTLLNRNLTLIVSTCDLSAFSPGRPEVCSFLNCLWEVMSRPDGPQWNGVAVLSVAARDATCRHALIHTYRFMPIFAKMLSNNPSAEKKLHLLELMQDLSFGIKITWQESYLSSLLKQLCDYVQNQTPRNKDSIADLSLSVLVNLCYGNMPVVYVLMRTIDTRELFRFLESTLDTGAASVQLCRLMVALQQASTNYSISMDGRVHRHLDTTMMALQQAITNRDQMQLLFVKTFLQDLSEDPTLRPHLLTYTGYNAVLKEVLKATAQYPDAVAEPMDTNMDMSPRKRMKERSEKEEAWPQCLRSLLSILLNLISLEIESLKPLHCSFVDLSVRCTGVCDCLGPSLALLAIIVQQYNDEEVLPEDILASLYIGVNGLLAPPSLLEIRTGLEWLIFLEALCHFNGTRDTLLHHVSVENFEETVFNILQHCSECGPSALVCGQSAALSSCSVCVQLAVHSDKWDAALQRMLSNVQVQKMLSNCLSDENSSMKRDILKLIKHTKFSEDKINSIFGRSDTQRSLCSMSSIELKSNEQQSSFGSRTLTPAVSLSPAQENAIDNLISKLNSCFDQNKIIDIVTSSVMELYGYKMSCMEQTLHSNSIGLQSATERMSSLERTNALLRATNTTQMEALRQSHVQNERLNDTMKQLNIKNNEAKNSIMVFKAKLTGERAENANQLTSIKEKYGRDLLQKDGEIIKQNQKIDEMGTEMEEQKKENQKLQNKLGQQSEKNSELASVLTKFEERVKSRDKRLEESSQLQANLKRENEQLMQTLKEREKTIVERDTRLGQLTTQLEDMKRVQEMVTKLMTSGNKKNS